MDPDLVRFKGGDTQLEQYSRNKNINIRRRRLETEIDNHRKLVLSLQKLNFMKGFEDDNSLLSLMPFDEYLYEQVKLLNFVYNNIFTKYHQQEKLLAKSKVPRPLALKNKKSSSSEEESPVRFSKGVDHPSEVPFVASKKKSKRRKKSKRK
jgi:hypothetical protein